MFSENDLVTAVERHLLQVAETCRGLWVARSAAARPGRRPPLRERLEKNRPDQARPAAARPESGRSILTAPHAEETPAGARLAAEAKAWRRGETAKNAAPSASMAAESIAPNPPRAPVRASSSRPALSSGASPGEESAPITLFITPGKTVFLTVKRRRLTPRPEEAVALTDEERSRHRRLRDCGFAVHVIAAETPADARDQVSALLRRLGLTLNG